MGVATAKPHLPSVAQDRPSSKSRSSTSHYAHLDARDAWTVQTSKGPVRGGEVDGIGMFLGVPFAQPPVGDLRWRAPTEPDPWDAILECTRFGPACPQSHVAGKGNKAVPIPESARAVMMSEARKEGVLPPGQDEDCLQLNVYTPGLEGAPGLEGTFPTVVWFYGGNLTGGSACSDNVFDPSARHGANPLFMCKRHKLVVVTATYRVNVFGFLSLPGGDRNCGLLDAAAVLRWVNSEIGKFGGDAGNITICGLSAGGHVCSQLLTMPVAKGLFHKAICMSGSAQWTMGTMDDHNRRCADPFMRKLGFDSLAEVDLEEARLVPAEKLRQVYRKSGEFLESGTLHVDGQVVPEDPIDSMCAGCAANVKVLSGITRDEGVFSSSLKKKGNTLENVIEDVFQHLRSACYLMDGDVDALRSADPTICREIASGIVQDYLDLVSRYENLPDDVRGQFVNLGLEKIIGKSDKYYELAVKILGDHDFLISHLMAVWALSQHTSVHAYVFSGEALVGEEFASHGADQDYLFGTQPVPKCGSDAPAQLSDTIMEAWVSFARNGDPSTATSGEWPPLSFPPADTHTLANSINGMQHMNLEYSRTGLVSHGWEETRIWFSHIIRLQERLSATGSAIRVRPSVLAMATSVYSDIIAE